MFRIRVWGLGKSECLGKQTLHEMVKVSGLRGWLKGIELGSGLLTREESP